MDKYNLGKNGKFGDIDLSKIYSGIQANEICNDQNVKSLFNIIDSNEDGKLGNAEIQALLKNLDKNGDKEISSKELNKLLDKDGKKLNKNSKKLFMQLLNDISSLMKDKGVEKVSTTNNSELITYEDGHTEQVFEDGSQIITRVDDKKNTIKTEKNSSGDIEKETTTAEDGTTTVVEYKNGEPIKTVKTLNQGNYVETISNIDGKEHKTIVDKEKGITTEYVDNVKVKVQSPNAMTTFKDGLSTTNINNGELIEIKDNGGNLLSRVQNEALDGGSVKTTETTFNGDDYNKEVFIDTKKISQIKVVNGKTYSIDYDGEGNTVGIVVQNGESISMLAKRFNCSVEEIIKLNRNKVKQGKRYPYFLVGAEIKIPREIEADAEVLQSRQSREEAIQSYKDFMVKRNAEKPTQPIPAEKVVKKPIPPKSSLTDESITYVKNEDGSIVYSRDGAPLNEEEVKVFVEKETEAIYQELNSATKGGGTDEELVVSAVGKIYSAAILESLNKKLEDSNKGNDMTSPLESLLLSELSHTEVNNLIRVMRDNGAFGGKENTSKEVSRNFVRELEYEIKGYTGRDNLVDVMNLIENSPETRKAAEALLQERHPKLTPDENSYVRAFLKSDGWEAQEIDQFDAVWIKNNSYAPAKVEKVGNSAYTIVGIDQNHRNRVINRLAFDYDDQEALHVALESIYTKGFNGKGVHSADYITFEQACKNYNQKNNIEPQFKGQDAVQTYLAYRASLEESSPVRQAENISAKNRLLFKDGEKPVRVQAEEIAYSIKNGDFSNAFKSTNPDVYTEISKILADNDFNNIKNINDLYETVIKNTKAIEQLSVKTNALLSGQVNFSDDEIVNIVVVLMQKHDALKIQNSGNGQGFSAQNTAVEIKNQINTILLKHSHLIDKIKEKVGNENFEFTKVIGSHMAPGVMMSEKVDTKQTWQNMLSTTEQIVDETIFYNEEGNQITDVAQVEKLKTANLESLKDFKSFVDELEREHKVGVDAEGNLSSAANWVSEYSGLGTDRDDVANTYLEAKNLLIKLEAAAEGRLRDKDGNVISLQDLAEETINRLQNLEKTNANYNQTVSIGKMIITLAPILAVTTVVTGGASAVGMGATATSIAAGAAASTVTYGVNTIEQTTSYTGNTAQARENTVEDALINGVLTAIGMRVGFATNNIATGSSASRTQSLLRKASAAGIDITTDSFISSTADFIKNGTVSEEAFIQNLIISGTATVAAHALSGVSKADDITNSASSNYKRLEGAENAQRNINDGTGHTGNSRKAESSGSEHSSGRKSTGNNGSEQSSNSTKTENNHSRTTSGSNARAHVGSPEHKDLLDTFNKYLGDDKLRENATLAEINKAFKKLANKHHPDKFVNEADKVFHEEILKIITNKFNAYKASLKS